MSNICDSVNSSARILHAAMLPAERPSGQNCRCLEFFYFDAGGGHRSAAMALREVINERYPHWSVDLVNLQELLKPIDPVSRLTQRKMLSQSIYNRYLKTGLTYGSGLFLRILQKGIQSNSIAIQNQLEQHWRCSQPDLVVSLIPNFNGLMFQALRRIHPKIPYVTVMTDLADCPPHFWQEQQDQYLICGDEEAVRQAQAIGYRPERILRTSGMILRPCFYREDTRDRETERNKHGLDPTKVTALVMFGGYGSKLSATIVDRLNDAGLPIQSMVLCGHHEPLRRQLQGKTSCLAVGFTDNIPYYMRLADFFIGKPGPGCLSEAIHMGLPVIIEHNQRTLLQERFNATWVQQREVGIVVRSFNQIDKAVRSLLREQRLEAFRDNVRRFHNRAVYEIPALFAQMMGAS
ncbi:MAG: glycosyltransferase [Candidatus Competibacteraceae bacterium]